MKQHLDRRTKILLGVTLVAALFLAFDFLSRGKAPRSPGKAADAPAVAGPAEPKPSPNPSAVPGVTPAATPAPNVAAAPPLAPPPPADQPWGKRDPFETEAKRLPQGPKGADQFSGYKLTGIVCSPQGCKAVINDRVGRVGDQVEGARIVKITKTGVELEKNGETRFFPVVQKEFFQ